MKINKILIVALGLFTGVTSVQAGNEDRAGSAGASQLLVNPWARSAGFAGAGVASSTGLESLHLNVAGLAFTDKTELQFNHTNWLAQAGISLNSFGLGQRVGESSVIGVSVTSFNFGDIPITTTDLPEGGIGTYKSTQTSFAISYAREFSKSIYGGINMKVLSESIPNLRSQGVAIDAGIRYVTGETDNIKFGISLKNVGPPMSFAGDGLSVTTFLQSTGAQLTTEQRSARFELPSLVNIGASYDFNFNEAQKLTLAGAFTSNSFTKDQYRIGAEYTYKIEKASFTVRGGYLAENGILSEETISTALTGPTAGVSVETFMGESGSGISIDYCYRAAAPFNGIHTIGARIYVR